jgi:DNA helicase-2/ATP-dependent DNA helicase PcrA
LFRHHAPPGRKAVKIEEQEIIIKAPITDRILVQAGPGTGKTEVVARRIAHLISSGMKPSQLLVLSFSRSAVRVLIERVRNIKGVDSWIVEEMRHISVRTFDSFSFRILRQLGKTPAELLQHQYDDNIRLLIEKITGRAIKVLFDNKEIGFSRIEQVIVDELQDLNGLRAMLVREFLGQLTSTENPNGHRCGFTLLGDSHQAIYGFSSKEEDKKYQLSSADLIAWTIKSYPELQQMPLTKNMRSQERISAIVTEAASIMDSAVSSGKNVWDQLKQFVDKSFRQKDLDSVVVQYEKESSSKRVAILCRDNSQVLQVGATIRELVKEKKGNLLVDVASSNAPRVIPSWIAGILHKFRAENVTRNNFKRIYEDCVQQKAISMPCRGNWEAAWNMLLRFAAQPGDDNSLSMQKLRERMSWLDSLPDDEAEEDRAVVVTTIHQAKGLEYDLVTVMYGTPQKRSENTDLNEEARVLFVGVSRAKKDVILGNIDEQESYYNKQFAKDNRSRWYKWNKIPHKGTHHNLELGINGDIDQHSFVNSQIVGDVKKLQEFLQAKQQELRGKPVVLKKIATDNSGKRFLYEIHLQENDMIIGRTTQNIIFDLLNIKHKDQSLPVNIYDLRIRTLITMSTNGGFDSAAVPEPWSSSKLWLGIDIHGMSSFFTFWRKS